MLHNDTYHCSLKLFQPFYSDLHWTISALFIALMKWRKLFLHFSCIFICLVRMGKKNNAWKGRFYPQDPVKFVAVRVCPAIESRPLSPPPAAASPASFPEIHQLPSPHTHHLSETSLGNSLSVKTKIKSFSSSGLFTILSESLFRGKKKTCENKKNTTFVLLNVLSSVSGRTTAPSHSFHFL